MGTVWAENLWTPRRDGLPTDASHCVRPQVPQWANADQGCVSRGPGQELQLPHVQNSLSWYFQAVQLFICIRNSMPVLSYNACRLSEAHLM